MSHQHVNAAYLIVMFRHFAAEFAAGRRPVGAIARAAEDALGVAAANPVAAGRAGVSPRFAPDVLYVPVVLEVVAASHRRCSYLLHLPLTVSH